MKQLITYINENKSEEYAVIIFITALKNTKINKDIISIMLNNLDMKMLKIISDYLEQNDSSNYLAYSPNVDLFNSESNKDKITLQISEYIYKNITMN